MEWKWPATIIQQKEWHVPLSITKTRKTFENQQTGPETFKGHVYFVYENKQL